MAAETLAGLVRWSQTWTDRPPQEELWKKKTQKTRNTQKIQKTREKVNKNWKNGGNNPKWERCKEYFLFRKFVHFFVFLPLKRSDWEFPVLNSNGFANGSFEESLRRKEEAENKREGKKFSFLFFFRLTQRRMDSQTYPSWLSAEKQECLREKWKIAQKTIGTKLGSNE